MSYEIQFTDDKERRRIFGTLPETEILVLEKALESLSNNPFGKSHSPPLPYRPIGRMCEIQLKPDGRIHYVRLFFHIDTMTEMIAVRRVTIDPTLEKKPAASEPNDKELAKLRETDVAMIPQHRPK